ncbi:glycosyltransferase family 4 protein [Candidatus Bathyarchaeota archaeon]|nr:glycosyltransferase family 4 protein [Candidatus Bathyarchaeota archaeon]
MFVNWPIHRVGEFDCNVRNPDQVVSGERYWFSKYWPSNTEVDVVGIQRGFLLHPLEKFSRIYLQHAKAFNKVNDYDLLLTFDSPTAFLFALLRSKVGICRSVPHIMIDVGLPRASENFKNTPSSVMCGILKQTFNPKSVSHIIFFSSCQRSFYRDALGFPEGTLSYVPFGVESDYFKPEPVEGEDYIFAAGEFRDFDTLLRVYEKWAWRLPELRIRSDLSKPKHLPPKISWLPRVPISTFKTEALKAKFVVVPLHYTLRSTGVMTCLQFMALGKAVLIPRVPPIDGYATDGKTALYYEPYDPEDLFRKISLLSEGTRLVEDIGKEARKAIETKFDLENMGKQLWSCVSEVLKSSAD